jgi:hypothetical protein
MKSSFSVPQTLSSAVAAVAAVFALACSDPPEYQRTTPATGGTDGEEQPGTGGTMDPGPDPNSQLGTGTMQGMGSSISQYHTAQVSRNGVPYVLITNGWGPGFQSHNISWSGTSFTVVNSQGSPGGGGEPASYPTVFCGKYSVNETANCGLPRSIDSITSLRTGWRWAPNGNSPDAGYNAAYDIWVGDGNNRTGFLMVWLRDPPNFRPAGQRDFNFNNSTVAGLPGTWQIWHGTVNISGQNIPIINWVKSEGQDIYELEFDVMDLVRDAQMRGLNIPGTHINSVAVGFEIWQGPITNLQSVDFYVDVQ